MTSNEFLASRLRAIIGRLVPGAGDLAELRALPGGASQETWAFDAVTPGGRVPLILRRAPPGSVKPAEAVGLEIEAPLLEQLFLAGAPVPRVAGVLRPQDGIGEGYVMERIQGEANSRRILREPRYANARSRLAWQCGEALARVHRIRREELPSLPLVHAHDAVAYYRERHDLVGTPRPVFELAFQWLRNHLPDRATSTVLVHGDFRNGNIMIDEHGLRAVLDWEIAHLGDPMEDLGWMCVNSWRYGRELPVGGFGTREQLFAGYEAGGGQVDPARVRFWEVMGTLKWGVICESMAVSYQSGDVRTVERAAVGRRASEAEIDLLCLMQQGEA
ncbi:MAG TPA: phosphotransferase family protein [Noviherbaspirillum sp.]|uniref:phosphotransferase family protein n=1 Tax=Noviherbaspirillum sp. TaxID=1926288 RepID=UPI002B49A58B|nr:phosphotransferase family protein [Noviherbaspirillum sp.]HJV88447.1 phosphotransferase family protein [Noviherbaspirillum sp.]